jgi:hypothetical protein
MTVRPGTRRAGVAAALATACAAAALAVVHAAPGAAAGGIFLYTDGESGLITGMYSPPNEKCFDVFKATEAKNFTDSDVILFVDGLCSEVLIKLGPGEQIDLTFNSFGFTPPGATGDHPGETPAARAG